LTDSTAFPRARYRLTCVIESGRSERIPANRRTSSIASPEQHGRAQRGGSRVDGTHSACANACAQEGHSLPEYAEGRRGLETLAGRRHQRFN